MAASVLVHGRQITHENNLLNEVAVLHPEDPLAAAVGHQLVAQVLGPVRPLVRPAAVPREATPRVSQPQQPGGEGSR